MSVTDELIANNARYAESFEGPLPLPPAKKVVVVVCVDARVNVCCALGRWEGEAHVIRNAGGVITEDEVRSLSIGQRLLGTEELILIHPTDCGMLTFTDAEFAHSLRGSLRGGPRCSPTWGRICGTRSRIVHSPFLLRKESVRAFVFDVANGKLNEVI